MRFKVLFAVGLMVLSSYASAGPGKLTCDPDTNICDVNVAGNYCSSGEVANTRWDIRTDQYVLSCECDCTSQENTFWLVGVADGFSVKTVDASKVVNFTELQKNHSGVPDIFGLVPYCSTPRKSDSALIKLRKMPTSDGAPQPYCYSVDDSPLPEVCLTEDCISKKELVKRVALIVKPEVLNEFKKATAKIYNDEIGFRGFPKRGFIERYISEYSYSKADQQYYNDIAYYWQQAGFNDDAIWLLEKIISNSPDRVVAYLNLADAYWGKNEALNASKNYKKYSELMALSGKQQKIPSRVKERSKL